jgi:hypothetical protein
MASGRQSLVLPLLWEAHRFATGCKEEAGRWKDPSVGGAAHGLRRGSSETYAADAQFRASDCRRTPKPPQIIGFRADGTHDGSPSAGRVSSTSLGDRAKPSPRQAFSGRPARIVGRVPRVSSGLASLQFGEAGLPRPNQSSACQSREQRQTGPRTPLRENEGRPRAKYDKKEHIKCSQVEYDSC